MYDRKKRRDRSLLRKGTDWIIESITGVLPTHFYINKVTRVVVSRFRPTDLRVSLEINRPGDWTPLANIRVNGTLGTVFVDNPNLVHSNEIKEAMTKHPGIATKYV